MKTITRKPMAQPVPTLLIVLTCLTYLLSIAQLTILDWQPGSIETVKEQQNFMVQSGPPAVLLLNTEEMVLTNDGATTNVMAQVRDEIGQPVADALVSFTSTGGNVQPATGLTNVDGLATTVFTASGTPGQIFVSAQVGELSQREAIQIVKVGRDPSGHTLDLDLAAPKVEPEARMDIVAVLRDNTGQPIPGELVSFFGSLGEISPASGVSDGEGRVITTYRAGSIAGQARITALSGVVAQSSNVQVGNQAPTATPLPPTATPVTPTVTPMPPTESPTATPVSPTATPPTNDGSPSTNETYLPLINR